MHLGSSKNWTKTKPGSYTYDSDCSSNPDFCNATHAYVASEKTPFKAQITDALPGPKLSAVHTVKDYAEWMVGVVKEFGPKATFDDPSPDRHAFDAVEAIQQTPIKLGSRQVVARA